MPKQTGISDSAVSLPKGAGGLDSIENNFEVNKQKGTFHFSQAISVPEGRNELTPSLALTYSSANGNGPFGLGWSLSPAMFMRDTKFGVPRYRDDDPLTWSLAEKLVLMEDSRVDGRRRRLYRPQPDATYARIERFTDSIDDCWVVTLSSGIKQYYGQSEQSRVFETAHPDRVFQWCLNRVEDTFGNAIVYEYARDRGEGISAQQSERHHDYHQLYLAAVRYVDYRLNPNDAESTRDYLYHVLFDYGQYEDVLPSESLTPDSPVIASTTFEENTLQVDERWHDRPDRFSQYKGGFEVRTARRCARILIAVKERGKALNVTQVYRFHYHDTSRQTNQFSQLQSIQLIGVRAGEKPEVLPATEFGYSQFTPTAATFEQITFDQNQLPPTALQDPQTTLVDLFGNGLPDILRATAGGYRYWKNKGDLQFEMAQSMPAHPAVDLSYPGTQFGDMQGNGSADLLVSYPGNQGFYQTRFDGSWNQFKPFAHGLSVNLADPQLRLFDTTGDGLVDAVLNTGERFLIYPNKGEFGFEPEPMVIPKLHDLDQFPDVSFSDLNRQVRLADMSGDGLQDIVMLHGSRVDYWPNLGHGRFGQRITMMFSPGLQGPVDYSRVHLVDIDGAGSADLLYLGTDSITVWANQQGNRFSDAWTIEHTPFLAPDAIQFADLTGQGGAGILYSYPLGRQMRYEFLDLLGQEKPYLLTQVDNNRGALTTIEYRSSTYFYTQAQQNNQPWQTHLPFPTQCVSQLTTKDVFSKGKLAMQFHYHHGHWDGVEREFRGFGHVVQRDTETFANYNSPVDETFNDVPDAQFSPPVETHHWFHLGAIAHSKDDKPREAVFDDEFWVDDPQRLRHLDHTHHLPASMTFDEERERLNALKGQLIRSEVYALDGSDREHRPYAVNETVYRLTTVDGIHGVYQYGSRNSNWERGDEPHTAYAFTTDFDARYGRAKQSLSIAVPRGKKRNEWDPADQITVPYAVTLGETVYAKASDPEIYINDRVASVTAFEIKDQTGTIAGLLKTVTDGTIDAADKVVLSRVNNYYDKLDDPFSGLPLGRLGEQGELVKSEQLAFNAEQLADFCHPDASGQIVDQTAVPSYLLIQGSASWPTDAPSAFTNQVPTLAGYRYEDQLGGQGAQGHQALKGYYQTTTKRRIDPATGSLVAERNALDQQTTIIYDDYALFPTTVTGPIKLSMSLEYDYLIGEVSQVTDANNNLTAFTFTPLGLLKRVAQLGKNNPSLLSDETARQANLADAPNKPSIEYRYDHLAYAQTKTEEQPRPIQVRTLTRKQHVYHHQKPEDLIKLTQEQERQQFPGHFIEQVAFQDGVGRLLQARKRIDATIYYDPKNPDGDPRFLSPDDLSVLRDQDKVIDTRLKRDDSTSAEAQHLLTPNGYAFVGGLKRYNNKGKVVVNYGSYYEQGEVDQADKSGHDCMAYRPPIKTDQVDVEEKLVTTRHFYDAIGREYKVVSDDGSMMLTLYGRVATPTAPTLDVKGEIVFIPSPWHQTTYDQNDNAKRTHPTNKTHHRHHYDTPVETERNTLGHVIRQTQYLRRPSDPTGEPKPIITRTTYDIKGNVLTITDPLSRPSFTYQYDLLNRAWRTWNIDGGLKRVILDALDRPIEMRNARDAVVFSAFDQANRPTFVWARDHGSPAGGQAAPDVTLRQVMRYGDEPSSRTAQNRQDRNINGELLEHFDASGQTTLNGYDLKGNPLSETQTMISPHHYVKEEDKPVFVMDWEVSWPSGQSGWADPITHTLVTRYDALDNPLEVTLPNHVSSNNSERVFRYTYNYTHGTVSQMVLDGQAILMQAIFSANGQPVLFEQGSGVQQYFAYDDQTLLLTRMLAKNKAGNLLRNTHHDYDLAGNIVAITEERANAGLYDPQTQTVSDSLTREFTYDSLSRLNSATGREIKPDPQITHAWKHAERDPGDLTQVQPYKREYQQDDVNNLTQTQLTQASSLFYQPTGSSNQLATFGTVDPASISPPIPPDYVYDDAGNMIEEAVNRKFTWDYANRLIRFEDKQTQNTTYYIYGSDGQRTHKIRVISPTELNVTIYLNQWFEYSYTATLNEDHELIKTENQRDRLHVNNGIHRLAIVTQANNTSTTLFCLTDHLGNIVHGLDRGGNLQFETEYYPYGQISLGGRAEYPYGFTGKERDAESGLYYYGARYYAAHLGRWISVDPAGASEGVNGYQFCENDPVNCVDLFGAQTSKAQDKKGKVNKTETEKNKQPSLATSMVPFYGPYREFRYHFRNSEYLKSSVDVVFLVADFTLLGGFFVKNTAKLAGKSLVKTNVGRSLLVFLMLQKKLKTSQNLAKLGRSPALPAISQQVRHIPQYLYISRGTGQAVWVARTDGRLMREIPSSILNAPPLPTDPVRMVSVLVEEFFGYRGVLDKLPGAGKTTSDLIIRNSSRTKQVRFDVKYNHGSGPHVNVEKFKPRSKYSGDKKMKQIENDHVFPKKPSK